MSSVKMNSLVFVVILMFTWLRGVPAPIIAQDPPDFQDDVPFYNQGNQYQGGAPLYQEGNHGGDIVENHIVPTPHANHEYNMIHNQYCEIMTGERCCAGRNDKCTMAIHDTICYCDMFCNRTISDCCPDFFSFCLGVPHPWYGPGGYQPAEGPEESTIINNCIHKGTYSGEGDVTTMNCNTCTCVMAGNELEWDCTHKSCLIREDIIHHVNTANQGWRASNYTFLWGLSLKEGIRYRLGTKRPVDPVRGMTSVNVPEDERLPMDFDARDEWPGLIHDPLDQGNCAASWAFSTVAVASDRLTLHSGGFFDEMLSAQQLVSCNHDNDQKACKGGHIDRAWWFLRRHGLVSTSCYPYTSGADGRRGDCNLHTHHSRMIGAVQCPAPDHWGGARVYHASPPYRIAANEREIMKEIYDNGPVQATMVVKKDFYMYSTGVYMYSLGSEFENPEHVESGHHSVRILGWGTDYSSGRAVDYWLCSNSWGTQWGDGGYFKILRGSNECEIESFVVGVWGKVNGHEVIEDPSSHRRTK